jgi:hypothetical protein
VRESRSGRVSSPGYYEHSFSYAIFKVLNMYSSVVLNICKDCLSCYNKKLD